MITTLTGSNDYQRTLALHKLVADFVETYTDMAVERFDGENTPTDRLREALQSLPFLTPRKLVVLREPAQQKDFAEHIADIIQQVPETTDVIIVEPKLDKRLAYYKTLKKLTDFQDHAELDANGLARWAVAYVQERGGSLSAPDARQLVERVGAQQQAIHLELTKLLAYDPAISAQSIEALTTRLPHSTVFALLDAAFHGQPAKTMALYQEQRDLKVEPQAILALLVWQLHTLALVKAAAGKSTDEIAKLARLNPFVVRKSQALARTISLSTLRRYIADLASLDYQLKRTAVDPGEALQNYLLAIAQ